VGCKGIRYHLSLLIDNQAKGENIDKINTHLDGCPDCREYYKSIVDIRYYCNSLSSEKLPSGFHDRLWKRINVEEEIKVLKRKPVISIAIGLLAVFLVIIIGVQKMDLSGLGQENSGSVNFDIADSQGDIAPVAPSVGMDGIGMQESVDRSHMDKGEAAPQEMDQEGRGEPSVLSTHDFEGRFGVGEKIIKSAYLGIETLEFDVLTNNITGKVNMMGGYIESSNIQGIPKGAMSGSSRRAHFVIRIPSKKFEHFINEVGELGNLITKEIGGENVTSQYFDTQARIKSLTIQEERLLSILEKAELLQDIIELESELSRVRYEIENYTGTLKRLDQLVDYSSISLDIYEVKELKSTDPDPDTLGDRLVQAFKQSLKNLSEFFENLIIFLVAVLPYLILLIPFAWIAWMVLARIIGNRSKNRKGGQDE